MTAVNHLSHDSYVKCLTFSHHPDILSVSCESRLAQYTFIHVAHAYSTDYMLKELAKEGMPLPFGNKFWASNWPTGKSPLPGLIVHFIPSVSSYYESSSCDEPHVCSITGYCYHSPAGVSSVSIHTQRRGLSNTNPKFLHCLGTFTLSSCTALLTVMILGAVLSTLEETQCA